jgi:hypothetical protein
MVLEGTGIPHQGQRCDQAHDKIQKRSTTFLSQIGNFGIPKFPIWDKNITSPSFYIDIIGVDWVVTEGVTGGSTGGATPDVYYLSVHCGLSMAIDAPDREAAHAFAEQCYTEMVNAKRVSAVQQVEIKALRCQCRGLLEANRVHSVADQQLGQLDHSVELLTAIKNLAGGMDERDVLHYRGYCNRVAYTTTEPARMIDHKLATLATALEIANASYSEVSDDVEMTAPPRRIEAIPADLPATASTTVVLPPPSTVSVVAGGQPINVDEWMAKPSAGPFDEWPVSRWLREKKHINPTLAMEQRFGVYAIASYHNFYGSEAVPPTRDGRADGATRTVNCYGPDDFDILEDAFHDMLHDDPHAFDPLVTKKKPVAKSAKIDSFMIIPQRK